jgi:hypothetical protein
LKLRSLSRQPQKTPDCRQRIKILMNRILMLTVKRYLMPKLNNSLSYHSTPNNKEKWLLKAKNIAKIHYLSLALFSSNRLLLGINKKTPRIKNKTLYSIKSLISSSTWQQKDPTANKFKKNRSKLQHQFLRFKKIPNSWFL